MIQFPCIMSYDFYFSCTPSLTVVIIVVNLCLCPSAPLNGMEVITCPNHHFSEINSCSYNRVSMYLLSCIMTLISCALLPSPVIDLCLQPSAASDGSVIMCPNL